jgi:hypothetical protein
MKFVVPKTETVICGTGKPYCPGTLCLMLQMGTRFWVEPPTSPGMRQQVESCLPSLPDGSLVPRGTKTYHYLLTTTGPVISASEIASG